MWWPMSSGREIGSPAAIRPTSATRLCIGISTTLGAGDTPGIGATMRSPRDTLPERTI